MACGVFVSYAFGILPTSFAYIVDYIYSIYDTTFSVGEKWEHLVIFLALDFPTTHDQDLQLQETKHVTPTRQHHGLARNK